MILQKYIIQTGRFKGKLNQKLLVVDTIGKISKGEPHPVVVGIVFHGYRENGKQRWQTKESYESSLTKQRKRREELKKRTPQQDSSQYSGLNKGSIPQKLLQTGLKHLKPGDKHPTEEGFILIRMRSNRSNPEQWGLPDTRNKKLADRKNNYDKNARASGVKKKDYRQTDQSTEFDIWDEHPFIEGLYFVGYYISKSKSTKGKRMERWATEKQLNERIIKARERNLNNKDSRAETNRKWRQKNRLRIKQNKKNYFQSIKDTRSYKENRNAYEKNRLENDEHFKIRKLYSGRLRTACRSQGAKKAFKTEEVLGCSIQKFKEHMESLFSAGMSWENFKWNGWHIDHIIPCAFFDLTKPSHQKVCFNWKNLQPLWAEDNLSKSDMIPLSIVFTILKHGYKRITLD